MQYKTHWTLILHQPSKIMEPERLAAPMCAGYALPLSPHTRVVCLPPALRADQAAALAVRLSPGCHLPKPSSAHLQNNK